MKPEVDIYKGERLVPEVRVDLTALILLALRDQLKDALRVRNGVVRLYLQFDALDDPQPVSEPPRLINLRASIGYVNVTAEVDGVVIYRHPHAVSELLRPGLLTAVKRLDPDETTWGYSIHHPVTDGVPLARPLPEVEGQITVDTAETRPQTFAVRKLAAPPPEVRDPADLGLDPDAVGPLNVGLTAAAARLLNADLELSSQVEAGGFLAGTVYRLARPDEPSAAQEAQEVQEAQQVQEAPGEDAEPDRYFVEIDTVIAAQHTGASLIHFTFTGDSFTALNRRLNGHTEGPQLLGWYHTHLFAATGGMGLSTIDVRLHLGTFRQPWQVAGLINLSDGERRLRFYGRAGDAMTELPYWIADDRDRYRRAHAGLGDG